MNSNPKPVAQLSRDSQGIPVLRLYHLTCRQLTRLYNLMVVNGDDPSHALRSNAKAHLGEFDTHDGRVSIHLYGEDTEFYSQFNEMLSMELDIEIPDSPIEDYRKAG